MVKSLAFILLFISGHLHAVEEEVPSPKLWYESIKQNLPTRGLTHRTLFLKRKKKQWIALQESNIGFLQPLPESYLTYLTEVYSPLPLSAKKADINRIFDRLPIDQLVFFRNKSAALYYKRAYGQVKGVRLKKKKSKLFKKRPIRWYAKKLGYDGVVIDRKNQFLLIQALTPYKQDAQALSLKNSSRKFIVTSKKKEGNALIQLVAYENHVGVFEILVRDQSSDLIKPGVKVLLGRKQASR